MADKFINETGVVAIRDWANGKYATKTALQTLQDEVDQIAAEGGEPNVIETIRVNGTALTPDAQKAVDLNVAQFSAGRAGSFQVSGVDGSASFVFDTVNNIYKITDPSDLSAQLATIEYVANNGGKIQKVKVNGTEQTIDTSDKSVNITVPTAVSDLTNDSGYQTASDVQSAINTAVASAYRYKGSVATQADLPSSGNTVGDVWDTQNTGVNYAWTGTAWDALGFYVDTSVLWTSQTGQSNSLNAMTVAEINAILEPSA